MTEVPQQPPAVAATAVAASPAETRKAAAHKLFKYVSGVLNDAHGVDQVQDCMDAIEEWLSKAEIRKKSPAASTSWFAVACDALAAAITAKAVPPQGVAVLATLAGKLSLRGINSDNSSLLPALKPVLCPACGEQPPVSGKCVHCSGSGRIQCTSCSGSGRFKPECRSCGGTGRRGGTCWTCGGSGKKDVGPCHSCDGSGTLGKCSNCETQPEVGYPRPFCAECAKERQASQVAAKGTGKGTGKGKGRAPQAPRGPPPKGVTIERCTASQLSDLQRLWEERQGRNRVLEAWKVDNPLLSYNFMERYKSLKQELGRNPDELQGFHGTHPSCVISICEGGFDAGRRAGQVYGSGEYFAKCPTVSEGYCKGGQYMLVCRLSLGIQSSTQENLDGDHIWVPRMGYYVISSPEQVLPLYILKFEASYRYGDVVDPKLTEVLSRRSWTTKPPEPIIRVPANRPCFMSRPTTDVLWMGLLHAHIPDEQIEDDVRSFLARHAPQHTPGLKVHVIKGKFKKAHAILTVPIPKDLVHRLNTATYVEGGKERRQICVEDGHGSPEQECPKFIAGYCRGQNLRYTHPCYCWHQTRRTEGKTYSFERIALDSAKGNEIKDKFMKSAPFHDGMPCVTGIRAIANETLARCHDEYRRYLAQKHDEEPTVRELYHGTNNNILDTLYLHGIRPPSDFQASDDCPVSGGKGLSTSLCNNDCKYCTEKHAWNRCHMYGLGIYLADMAQKSHRYCSQPKVKPDGRREYRMILCAVLGRAFTVEGYLKHKDAMHEVVNMHGARDLDEMVDKCGKVDLLAGPELAEKTDLLFIQGLGDRCRPGMSVVNSEYIAWHPNQCLPKYEITYTM